MSPAEPDGQRTRFRRPLGLAVIAYKAALGLSEVVVGALLAIPSFDPQATFARLSAEELREDPGDRLVALVGRHLSALLHHRGLVTVGLVVLGLAKLVAAAAMWEGQEWGGYLLAVTVALLLPFDLRQAVTDPTFGHEDVPPWIETSAAALQSSSARQLAEACQQVPPRQWWKAFVESYPRPLKTTGRSLAQDRPGNPPPQASEPEEVRRS